MPSADELISSSTAQTLARAIGAAAPAADLTALRDAARGVAGLALRERSDLLRDALLAAFRAVTPPLPAPCAWPWTARRTLRAGSSGP
ncbi:hypothetical protein OL239_15320 [Arthrobacter sp. ATA002]|uniref:hypothetical protein n=1 Tax=Arthrobacter sp. ATA002 TaxID=2991715 RepID=UPI0022A7C103|nr:hypothetical protein [Arthrobacter sp. ATA002]WAP51220.1 hypothetical protein OL239_15320 [Arthrobacter sp. ATA002]